MSNKLQFRIMCMAVIILLFIKGELSAQTTQTFTTSGTFVVPAGVTSVQVEAWGGGGAGGGVNAAANRGGGGGAGGSFTRNTSVTVTPGASITVTVGAGGTGSAGAAGGSGGTSTFGSAIPVSAVGGAGGSLGNNTTPYAAGAPTTTGITLNGGAGSAGNSSLNNSGAGGGGAGNSTSGGAASGVTGGTGGTGTVTGGTGAAGLTSGSSDGIDATALAAGGGGARGNSTNSSTRAGGDGFRGQVRVIWTCPTYSLTSTNGVSPICNSSATSVISVTGNAANLPVGTYTVTYNRSLPAATGLTATMTVTVAGSGSFTATGLTTAGSSTITITNISSGATGGVCSSTISSNNTKVITVTGAAPAAPGTITGSASVCAATTLNYSITAVANATNYIWSVPAGWMINSGQGTTSISVTTGNAGQNGEITVIAENVCGNTNPTYSAGINLPSSTNFTGFTSSSSKTSGNITTASASASPERRGYLKFPLSDIPSGAYITSASLSLTNNSSGALSSLNNWVNALGNNDPVTTAASTLYSACGSGTNYNTSTWNNTGTITLSLNSAAVTDISNRLTTPGYIAMGLVRGNGTAIYNFYGFGNGSNSPLLTVSYTYPRNLNVSVTSTTPTANAGSNQTICTSASTYTISGATASNYSSITWTTSGTGTFNNANLLNAVYTPSEADKSAGSVTLTLQANGNSPCGNVQSSRTLSFETAPTSNAGTDASTCVTGYELNGIIGGSATGVVWTTSGDGTFNNSNLLNAAYTPGANDVTNGNVTLTMTTTGSAFCSAVSDQVVLNVFGSLPASPTVNAAPASVCPPVTGVALSVNAVANAESYSWVSNSGGAITFTGPTNTTSTTVDLATTSSSTYSVHVYAVNACGTSAYTGIGIRRSVSTPSVITGAVVACDNANENYSVNPVGGAESYTWSGPAGSLINGQPTPQTITNPYATITFPSGYGTGTVSVTANVACFVSPARTLTVKSTPSVPVNLFGLNKICPGSTYTYNVPDVAGAVSYNWTVPAGVTITDPTTPPYGSTTEINFPSGYNLTGAAGNICVTAVSQCATESAPRCKSVVSIVPVITSAITANPAATGLCNTTANFSVAANANADEFIWTLPNGVTFNTAANLNAVGVQIPSGFTGGTVQVTAKNASCPVTGNVRTLNISGTPQTPGAITAFPGSICYNSPAMFSINAVNGATSYQWNVTGTGNIISGQSNTPPYPFIDVTWGNGNGVVQVRAVNSCGTSAYKMLSVSPSCREMAESAATLEKTTVFPNPSNGNFNMMFEGKSGEKQILHIMDLSGRIVYIHEFNNLNDGINSFEVRLPATAKGLFIAELRSLSKSEKIKLMVE